jgi:hypothetical protein
MFRRQAGRCIPVFCQLGRLLATKESSATNGYKNTIVNADESDIV